MLVYDHLEVPYVASFKNKLYMADTLGIFGTYHEIGQSVTALMSLKKL